MESYFFSLVILTVWAVLGLFLGGRKGRWADVTLTAGAFAAAGFGLYAAGGVLTGRGGSPDGGLANLLRNAAERMSLPFGVSGSAEPLFALDGLSAFFLLPVLILTPLCVLYGTRYLRLHGQNNGGVWFFFFLLAASMTALVGARDSVVFLLVWEIMALSSFFLVIADKKSREARYAGLVYFAATHIGTAFLLVFFFLAGRASDSGSFAAIAAGMRSGGAPAGVCFLLALIGFGTKAGIVPLHIWLPEAHPAAPSHASALMSGAMIKMGIYGILRAVTLIGPPDAWWGISLMSAGAVSGVAGILFAVSQHDLKRLLAYSSVENIGIILLGLGVGIYGNAAGMPLVSVLGLSGGLLHVLNHSLFKGMLFLGAGSVISAGGTGKLDSYGGLMKSMPVTGTLFIFGSVAICGLPPLNGFIGEFLIFTGAVRGIAAAHPWVTMLFTGAVVVLAVVGGFAGVCFTKAAGVVFLGEPRTLGSHALRESGPAMLAPMIVLAVLMAALSLGAGYAVRATELPVGEIAGELIKTGQLKGLSAVFGAEPLSVIRSVLHRILLVSGVLAGLVALLAGVRALAARKRRTDSTVTWDCGYVKPSAQMQYTASSYAQPLVDFFRPFLRTRKKQKPVTGYYPSEGSLSVSTPDFWMKSVYGRLIAGFKKLLRRAVRLQHGSIHLYILYLVAALILLMVWKLR